MIIVSSEPNKDIVDKHFTSSRLNNWLKIVQQKTLNFFLSSHRCLLCLSSGSPGLICLACEQELPWLGPTCLRCALPTRVPQLTCPNCCWPFTSNTFDGVQALFNFDWPIHIFIRRLKFKGQLQFAKLLGQWMAERLSPLYAVECVLPVPLHRQRQQERGFNQSLELSRHIAAHLKVPLLHQVCQKKNATVSQTALNAKKRLSTMEKSLFVVDPNFKAKHVLIVDDVVTTGATIYTLSDVLKKSGVSTVEIWACCRTLPSDLHLREEKPVRLSFNK